MGQGPEADSVSKNAVSEGAGDTTAIQDDNRRLLQQDKPASVVCLLLVLPASHNAHIRFVVAWVRDSAEKLKCVFSNTHTNRKALPRKMGPKVRRRPMTLPCKYAMRDVAY